jgi:hypothetical protein
LKKRKELKKRISKKKKKRRELKKRKELKKKLKRKLKKGRGGKEEFQLNLLNFLIFVLFQYYD